MAGSKDFQVKEKMEVASRAEQTTPGPVFTPEVDILETESDIILLADMPGVKSKDLDIDLRDNTLTMSGKVQPFEAADETDVFVEYEVGKYYRQFTISEVIDQRKIEALLKNGVLRLTLPKAEKAQPRKITVQSS